VSYHGPVPKIVSLTANRATLVDIQAALARAPNFIASLGLDDVQLGELEKLRLGAGHYAYAFMTPTGVVLKVTDDEDDARVCKMILEQGNGKPGLPYIQSVLRLPGDVYENETDVPYGRPLFAIVMEPVTPASKLGLSRTGNPFAERMGSPIRGRLLGEAVLYPSMEAELATDEARAFVRVIRRGIHWLAAHGVSVVDLHHGNLGYASGKRPVIIDFGHGSLQDEFIMKPIEMASNSSKEPTDLRLRLYHGTDAEIDRPSVEASKRKAVFANDDQAEAAVWGDTVIALRLSPEARVKELTHDDVDVATWSAKDSRRWREAGFDAVLVLPNEDDREEAYRYNIWVLLTDEAFSAESDAPVAMAMNPAQPTERQVQDVWRSLGSPRVDMNELRMGIEVEQEHTGDMREAGKIAMDHLREFPDYYTRLTKMEERAKAGLAPNGRASMPRVRAAFDECFDALMEQFPDFGDLELHQDEKAGGDNGHGSERQFGYCMDGNPIRIAFAAKTERLSTANVRGLVAHEFGHAIDFRYGDKLGKMIGQRLPAGVERRADAIAKAVFGRTIKYDSKDVQCVACQGKSVRPRRLGP